MWPANRTNLHLTGCSFSAAPVERQQLGRRRRKNAVGHPYAAATAASSAACASASDGWVRPPTTRGCRGEASRCGPRTGRTSILPGARFQRLLLSASSSRRASSSEKCPWATRTQPQRRRRALRARRRAMDGSDPRLRRLPRPAAASRSDRIGRIRGARGCRGFGEPSPRSTTAAASPSTPSAKCRDDRARIWQIPPARLFL